MSSVLKVDEIQNTGGTSALTIDSSGIVSQGTTVYSRASHGSNTGPTAYITFDSHRESNGGITFVDTNTAMQVPVAGLYLVGFNALGNTGSGAFSMQIRKNGAAITTGGNITQDTTNDNDCMGFTTFDVLSANDKIQFYVSGGVSHGNASYNNFFCVKIG